MFAAPLHCAGPRRQSRCRSDPFLTALPVPKAQAVVRGQYLFISASDDPTPANQDFTVNAFPFAVAIGATSKLALFGVVPVVHKSVALDTPLGRQALEASGLGDVVLFARYTEIADVRDPNSGGTRWDLDVGLQFVRQSYILEGIVQIPTVDRRTAPDFAAMFASQPAWAGISGCRFESNVPGLNPPPFSRSAFSRSGLTGCFELAEHVGLAGPRVPP